MPRLPTKKQLKPRKGGVDPYNIIYAVPRDDTNRDYPMGNEELGADTINSMTPLQRLNLLRFVADKWEKLTTRHQDIPLGDIDDDYVIERLMEYDSQDLRDIWRNRTE